MKVFEHYFCAPGASREELETAFREALMLDKLIGQSGHAAVGAGEDTALEENHLRRKAEIIAQRIAERKQQRIQQRVAMRQAERQAQNGDAASEENPV